jgi:hypothetical protein
MKPRLVVMEGGLGSESAPRRGPAGWNREWAPGEHGGANFTTTTARVDVVNPGRSRRPRVVVCGSRTITDRGAIASKIRALPRGAVVLTSRTYGASAAARDAALARGLHLEVWTALTERFRTNEAAYFARDEEMIRSADRVIAFWDGSSSGTAHELEYARRIGKPVELFPFGPPAIGADEAEPSQRTLLRLWDRRFWPGPRPSDPDPGGNAA